MTDQLTPSPDPPETQAPAPLRRPLGLAVAVGLIGLALGAGLMFFVLRMDRDGRLPPAMAAGQDTDAQIDGPPPDVPRPSEAAVYVSPARQQRIGVRTATVEEQTLDATLRTTGVLAYDETRIADVHAKVAGWIERVSVDFVGKAVRRGEALFSVYSPDLVATQKEYLLALRAQAELGGSRFPETRTGASSLLAAARERLRLWDLTDAQIAQLERTGEPQKSVTVFSPFDGIVLERSAFPGQYITPEVRTFRIADLSRVWVVAQVFETELAGIRIGQTASIEFPYAQSARTIAGRVAYIHPDIDPMTRRGRVRIELANPGLELRPDAYVTVVLGQGAGRRLAVPKEAVIDTGARRYAIVALADGYFEPRSIDVGAPAGDYYPVIAGLRAGERVVTSAQFLIDSESNLQAAMGAMTAPPPADAVAAPADRSATSAPPDASRLDITFRSQPDPPRAGENRFEVTVRDGSGQPIGDAEVTVTFFMPAMPSMSMPAMRTATTLQAAGDGVYRGTGQVVMAGRWDVTIAVTRGGQRLGSRQLAVIAQ
jgi:RND family efflux transporter MFP subunit